jgi:ABC-type molybdate transport system ATPase subunit
VIAEIKLLDEMQGLVKLKFGSQFLLPRITKKSLVLLNLRLGDKLFAQIKSVGFL